MNRAGFILIFLLVLIGPANVSANANNIHLVFVDDNNNIITPSVTVNGTSATVTSGIMDFNTNSATVDVNTTLAGYLANSFSFGFPGDSNIIKTVSLISDINAQRVFFRQRTTNGGALITDANISVINQDNNNIVGSQIIGTDSLFSVVVNPNQDYNFHVTGSGITDFNYSKQKLIV